MYASFTTGLRHLPEPFISALGRRIFSSGTAVMNRAMQCRRGISVDVGGWREGGDRKNGHGEVSYTS